MGRWKTKAFRILVRFGKVCYETVLSPLDTFWENEFWSPCNAKIRCFKNSFKAVFSARILKFYNALF